MATTIITKNGSGAPLAGDLQVGELAIDLTNKKLYSKEGTTVFEVGATGGGAAGTFTDLTATNSFTSVGIDDNATSTAITIDASENVGIGTTNTSYARATIVSAGVNGADEIALAVDHGDLSLATNQEILMRFGQAGGSGSLAQIGATYTGGTFDGALLFKTNSSGTVAERLRITSSGNVGINRESPNGLLHMQSSSGTDSAFYVQTSAATDDSVIYFGDDSSSTIGHILYEHSSNSMQFKTSTSERMRLDASGNVGIGETVPTTLLHLKGSDPTITLQDTSAGGIGFVQSLNGSIILYSDQDNTVANSIIGFRVDGTERMRIDSSGRVGINTSSPDSNIVSGIDNQSFVVARYDLSGGVPSGGLGGIYSANANAGGFSSGDVVIQARAGVNSRSVLFYTGNTSTERMRIDDSGNVGINVTDSQAKLDISGAFSSQLLLRNTVGDATAKGGTVSSAHYTNAEEPQLLIGGYSDGTNNETYVGGGFSSGNNSTIISFHTSANDTTTGNSERMRIDSSGNLLVGKTNTGHVNDGAHLGTSGCFLTAASTAPLTLRRSAAGVVIQLSRGGVNEGTLTMNTGAAPTLASGSDIRLKENVTEHCPELQNILSIKTRQWDWKDKEKGAGEGVVAQELETIYPDLVFEDNDGMLNVKDFGPMTTRLIKAIQEQQAIIDELKAEVAALKGE